MLELYDDREQTFTCGVKIEGTQYTKAVPRLIVSSGGKNIFFEGILKGDECHITIPPMSDIDEEGKVSLELVIDNALMTPWKSTYKVVSSFQTETIDPKIYGKELVATKRKQAEKREFKITDKLIVESKSKLKILKENTSKRTKILVNDLLTIYNTLPEKEKKLVSEVALKYKPKQKTFKWAQRIFKKPTSLTARICIYEVEQYLQKQEKPKKDRVQHAGTNPAKASQDSKKYNKKTSKKIDISKPDTRVMSQRIQKKKRKNEGFSTYRKLMMMQ